MDIFIVILAIIGACIYAYYKYEQDQEKKKLKEEDRNWINDAVRQIVTTEGDYDAQVFVLDKEEERDVCFMFHNKSAQIEVLYGKLRKGFTIKYDEIVDCKTYSETIVGESTTTAETFHGWSVYGDPNGTRTEFKTTKEPDITTYYINITTTSMSVPILAYVGTKEKIDRLEALIKIIIKKRQS